MLDMKRFGMLCFTCLVVIGTGCRSSYNEEAVKKLIEQPHIRAWADTFKNNSNLFHSRQYEVMVVSSKELPGREVRAIKDYLREKYDAEKVNYHFRKGAYKHGNGTSEKADK